MKAGVIPGTEKSPGIACLCVDSDVGGRSGHAGEGVVFCTFLIRQFVLVHFDCAFIEFDSAGAAHPTVKPERRGSFDTSSIPRYATTLSPC